MKKHFSTLLLVLMAVMASAQTMTPGKAYYIVNNYYDRVISHGDKADVPRLSIIGTNPDETYVFDCEACESNPEYVYLKQRSSGLWLAATNQNTWGMVLTTEQNMYGAWKVAGGMLSNNKAKDKYLGVDTGGEKETYVGIYYDKGNNERSQWHFVEAVEGGYEASIKAAEQAASDAEANSKNAVFLTSGDTLGIGPSYTLGLDGVRFRSNKDTADILLRNNMGMGVKFRLHKNHIILFDGTVCKFPEAASCNYRFTCDNGQLAITRDDSLLATVKTYPIPVLTTVGADCEWTLLNAKVINGYMPVIYSRSKALKPGEWEKDKMGHNTFDVVFANNVKTLQVTDDVDVHILRKNPFLGSCQINIVGDRSRLIFDNWRPGDVMSVLSVIKIDGKSANTTTNCRVGIYLTGTVVFAKPRSPFIGYSGEQYTGDEIPVTTIGRNTDLGDKANEMRSFILRRGYMATLASGEGQNGYTRVFVADHEDLLVPVLPDALNRRVSSVHIKQWQYVSKKGWCSTTGDGAIASEMSKVNATWFYTWSADRSSTNNAEYIPIRQHVWWPSVSQVGGHKEATACLMFNEPEHGEQHDKCDCGGVISEWKSCEKTPEMGKLGMRVGSPSPTDLGWVQTYIDNVDKMAYRCDFVAIHCYWGPNEANGASAWRSRLQDLYNKTKRPIWITEWNYGASWTTESWPSGYDEKLEKERKAIREIVEVLESLDFVERYAVYNWDTEHRCMINWNSGWVTPAGREYRDYPSTFAYNAKVQKVPNWWAPSVKDVTLSIRRNNDGTAHFVIDNPNGDMTETLVIEQQQPDGTYQTVHSFTSRYVFDEEKQEVTLSDVNGTYRVNMVTVRGDKKTSALVTIPELVWNEAQTQADATSYITNPDCTDGTSGWIVSNVETAKGESYDAVASNWYWNIWKSSAYVSTMGQALTSMPRGYYSLSALLRGQDHVVMTLSLQGDTAKVEQTVNGTGNTSLEGSPYQNGWLNVTTDEVLCLDGTLTISLMANNPKGAGWWSADHFTLNYRPDPNDAVKAPLRHDAVLPAFDLSGRRVDSSRKGIVIQGGRKKLVK